MATWGLIVETTVGGEHKRTKTSVLAHVEGEREEALAELERRARDFVPQHPWNPKRRRFFRHGDGFLLVLDGSWQQSYSTRFTLAELLEDSAAAPEPAEPPAPEPAEPPAPADSVQPPPAGPAEERDADGVPVKPAWLGRTDLP
ncbi:hypothetical protein [Streptomyces roseoverticillatus]|uniref:hypothetical protein n=1 Tax=Streptomyces roseoverticillatus TaxID=66429 RepID=UPI0004BF991C|nr:hypothetical protein [Streptomyces roseoverticillatus]